MTAPAEDGKRLHELNTYRDTVESIGVAIVLAFVLRAFFIEAFVIPTGSMAPRLLGEHWDLRCPTCGYSFAYGYSAAGSDERLPHNIPTPPKGARCPNCRTPYPANEGKRAEYLDSGDRVLVMKYIYNFLEPQPFDVVVFKNPQDNHENYIKRLIGLPGETIEIVHGDIFVSDSPEASAPRRIRRKPPRAQEAMWQVVYDNDYFPDRAEAQLGHSGRWRGGEGAAHWDLGADDGRCFVFNGDPAPAELFLQADAGLFLPSYGYNYSAERDEDRFDSRVDVCTDLKLSAVLMPREEGAGEASLKLSSFGVQFEAEFHADGEVVLKGASPDIPSGGFRKIAHVRALKPGEGRRIGLAHVDFRASAWVDGECVLETADEEYPGAVDPNDPARTGCYAWLKRHLAEAVPVPDVRIAAQGASCEIRHVALHRDVYYTSARLDPIPGGAAGDYAREIAQAYENPQKRAQRKLAPGDLRHKRFSDAVRGWGAAGSPIQLARNEQDHDLDEFLMLGDNSPQSRDGRMWTSAAPTLRLYNPDGSFLYQLGTVPRYNLLGKAMFVYWPGGFRVPMLPSLPIVPNVGKMRFIR
jgi:signal peptidase I